MIDLVGTVPASAPVLSPHAPQFRRNIMRVESYWRKRAWYCNLSSASATCLVSSEDLSWIHFEPNSSLMVNLMSCYKIESHLEVALHQSPWSGKTCWVSGNSICVFLNIGYTMADTHNGVAYPWHLCIKAARLFLSNIEGSDQCRVPLRFSKGRWPPLTDVHPLARRFCTTLLHEISRPWCWRGDIGADGLCDWDFQPRPKQVLDYGLMRYYLSSI